jgi:antitoxin PrlF
MTRQTVSFAGAVTTTGSSAALRLEKSFFRANPEFRQRAKVRAHVLGRGQVLLSLEDDADANAADEDARDPVVAAYLAFLERDMASHPEHLSAFSVAELDALNELLKGAVASDDDLIPDDVTL